MRLQETGNSSFLARPKGQRLKSDKSISALLFNKEIFTLCLCVGERPLLTLPTASLGAIVDMRD